MVITLTSKNGITETEIRNQSSARDDETENTNTNSYY